MYAECFRRESEEDDFGGRPVRKLLNTLYVTDEKAYLSLEGETLVCTSEGRPSLKLPLVGIENICCFSYLGCSPALMGKCADKGIGLAFFNPYGRFLARVTGAVKGNVYTRARQIEAFKSNTLSLIHNNVAAKLMNTRHLIERTIRDYGDDDSLTAFSAQLKERAKSVYGETDVEIIRGVEGACAKKYFELFGLLIRNERPIFHTYGRSKHPPLDAVNAVLSFLYSVLTNDFASALESAGLDSYIGFYHTQRPGRVSLACDMVEEVRCIAERMVISMINLKMLDEKDFEKQPAGAVFLSDRGRKKVLAKLQEKKREKCNHYVLKQKVPYGLIPFVQSNLMAKFVRGEIEEYPPFVMR